MLDRKNQTLKDIIRTLQIYHDNIDEDGRAIEDNEDRGPLQKEILRELMTYLESC